MNFKIANRIFTLKFGYSINTGFGQNKWNEDKTLRMIIMKYAKIAYISNVFKKF